MRKPVFFGAMFLLATILCFADGIDGIWGGKYEAQYDVTLNVKVTGKQLTGTMLVADNNPISENPGDTEVSPFIAAQMGENSIIDGTVNGQEFTFHTTFNGAAIPYRGKIEADKIVLTAKFKGQDVTTTLRRLPAK